MRNQTLACARVTTALTLLAAATATLTGCHTATPERTDPGVVALEGTLSNTFVPAGENGEMVARVRISTTPLEGSARPPIHLALVIDTSGSMAGEPIEDAREAALAIVDLMREGDRLSVTAFHSTTQVLLPSTEIDGDLDELKEQIGAMEAAGTTDMAGGLQAGLQELMGHLVADGVNRVVLLGDGVPNDENGIVAMAQAAGERGIAVTAIGLGLDYNETLMGDVARVSGGQFHYAEDSSTVATVFRDEVLRMQRVFGRNAVVALQPGPGVQIRSVIGQNVAAGQSGAVHVTLGDLHEGEHRDLLVRATVDGHRDGASVELMDVHLAFDDAVMDAGRLERRIFLGAKATADEETLTNGRNAEIERAAAQMQAAAVTIEAIRVARGGELDRARAMLDQAQREAQSIADSTGDADVAETASSMRAVSEALPSVAAEPEAERSIDFEDDQVGGEIAPAPADAPARLREAHDSAMGTLGY